MAKFFVGQRVRIKYTASGRPENVGREATVTDTASIPGRVFVVVDGVEAPSPWPSWLAYPDQLEPLSDSNTLVSWESMRDLWVPEHLRVTA